MLPFTNNSDEKLLWPAKFDAAHVYKPLLTSWADDMVRTLVLSPILVEITFKYVLMGSSRKYQRIFKGKSPFATWHISVKLSPEFASPSKANGLIDGKTE